MTSLIEWRASVVSIIQLMINQPLRNETSSNESRDPYSVNVRLNETFSDPGLGLTFSESRIRDWLSYQDLQVTTYQGTLYLQVDLILTEITSACSHC